MEAALTIENFSALLRAEQDDNPLLQVLRQLAKIEKPEDVLVLVGPLGLGWWG
jgi:hypothetical protein